MKFVNNSEEEKSFYDKWAESVSLEDILVDETFTAITAPENRYIEKKLGPIKEKNLLEIGCGFGEASVYLSKKGAKVVASDISPKMVTFVKRLAEFNKTKIKVCQASAEKLPFQDESFDIVYAANVLHHVEIKKTLKEARRVLKKGGIFVSWDPLDYNPLINFYRKKAFKVRTKGEHPLKWSEVKMIKKYFNNTEIKTTWFFTLWIFIKFYLIERINPNEERYWKKIISDSENLRNLYSRLEKVDNVFLKVFPFLHKYCWNVVIIGRK